LRAEKTRETPFHKPHSTEVLGLSKVVGDDERFCNNLFVGHKGLAVYDAWKAVNLQAVGNVYLAGAKPSTRDRDALVTEASDPGIRLQEKRDGWWFEITVDPAWTSEQKRAIVTTESLGKAKVPDAPYEQPDGTPYRLDTNYFGKKRKTENPAPGPFQFPSKKLIRLKVWPKKPVKVLQEDFRKLEFGMFIHYNMATYKGVQWVSGYHNPADFNPGGTVDTDAWADAAVSAGMKYGVLTAKHVAGFCLWDSEHTTYDVMHPDCPYKQDLVAQFIKSFKSRGLKVGLYYCWRNPGFDTGKNKGKFKVLPPECDPATHTLKEQNEFQKAQIAELLTMYPDVFYVWNDGLDDKVMPADEILTHIRGVHPDILVSANWWSWAKKGTPYVDIAVKEMRPFPETNTAPGETCWSLEQKWFWNEGFRSKPAKQMIGLMTTAHSRNSNFLLNVGPDRNGNIIESSIKTLAEIGKLRKP
jgi:alpha-L-fucosidase